MDCERLGTTDDERDDDIEVYRVYRTEGQVIDARALKDYAKTASMISVKVTRLHTAVADSSTEP